MKKRKSSSLKKGKKMLISSKKAVMIGSRAVRLDHLEEEIRCDEEFTKDEIRDIRGFIKDGLLQKPLNTRIIKELCGGCSGTGKRRVRDNLPGMPLVGNHVKGQPGMVWCYVCGGEKHLYTFVDNVPYMSNEEKEEKKLKPKRKLTDKEVMLAYGIIDSIDSDWRPIGMI